MSMSMSSSRRVELAEKSVTLADLHMYYERLGITYVSNVEKDPARAEVYAKATACRTLLDQLIEAHDELVQAHRKLTM